MNSAQGVILLGASGFFGPVLAEEFGTLVAALTYATRAIEGGLHYDVRKSRIADLISGLRVRPDTAVIMLGTTNMDACARDPSGTALINVTGTIRLVHELRELGVAPVFLSSDAVFDGTREFWTESDEPRPILAYGRQKREVEQFIASLSPPWLIVRLPKLISLLPDSRSMLTQWIEALSREDRILCATDQYFTPAAISDAARAIAALVRERAHGLYHLGGPQRLSRRELLRVVEDEYAKFAVPKARVTECSLRDIPVLEQRPLDTSLNSDHFRASHTLRFIPAAEIARSAVRSHFGKKTS